MVNFPTTYAAPASTAPAPTTGQRKIIASSAAGKREARDIDRRLTSDRRSDAGTKPVVDRRSGSERRRCTINVSV